MKLCSEERDWLVSGTEAHPSGEYHSGSVLNHSKLSYYKQSTWVTTIQRTILT